MSEVFHLPSTLPLSAKKKTVAAAIAAVTSRLVTAAMAAATVFFFAERGNVEGKWKTSLTVAGLICGIAFWHYLYMRGVWVDTCINPNTSHVEIVPKSDTTD